MRLARAVRLPIGTLACAIAWIGCASALKEPRPIPEMGGAAPPEGGAAPEQGAGPADVQALLAQAGALFAERGPDAAGIDRVRLAARAYLRAAAGAAPRGRRSG